MFIKLTRTDGRPIWINPEFIVTVEGRKDGGSIVVPGGDGLDYDVKESPQTVMDLCGGKVMAAEIPPPPALPADPPPHCICRRRGGTCPSRRTANEQTKQTAFLTFLQPPRLYRKLVCFISRLPGTTKRGPTLIRSILFSVFSVRHMPQTVKIIIIRHEERKPLHDLVRKLAAA